MLLSLKISSPIYSSDDRQVRKEWCSGHLTRSCTDGCVGIHLVCRVAEAFVVILQSSITFEDVGALMVALELRSWHFEMP